MEPNPYDYVPSSPKLTTQEALDEFKRPMSPPSRRIANMRGRQIELFSHKHSRSQSQDDKVERHPVVAAIPVLPLMPIGAHWTSARSDAIEDKLQVMQTRLDPVQRDIIKATESKVGEVHKVSDHIRRGKEEQK